MPRINIGGRLIPIVLPFRTILATRFLPDCLHRLLPGPFLLSTRFILSLFFVLGRALD